MWRETDERPHFPIYGCRSPCPPAMLRFAALRRSGRAVEGSDTAVEEVSAQGRCLWTERKGATLGNLHMWACGTKQAHMWVKGVIAAGATDRNAPQQIPLIHSQIPCFPQKSAFLPASGDRGARAPPPHMGLWVRVTPYTIRRLGHRPVFHRSSTGDTIAPCNQKPHRRSTKPPPRARCSRSWGRVYRH